MKKQRFFQKPLSPIISTIVLAIALVLLIISSLGVWRQQHVAISWQQQTQLLTPIQTQHLNSLVTPQPKIPVQTFTSLDLGISFHYRDVTNPSDQTTYPVLTKELGNKIYIYQGNFNPDQEKYVEVLTKSPTQSIASAVKQYFLQDYSDTCTITIESQSRKYLPSTYIRAEAFPVNRFANSLQCPGYLLGGVEYFLMDIAYPDKLLYFHIGQDNYASGIHYGTDFKDELTWDETVTFLPMK